MPKAKSEESVFEAKSEESVLDAPARPATPGTTGAGRGEVSEKLGGNTSEPSPVHALDSLPPTLPPARRWVEVLVENLGPRLWHKGDVTDDEQLVALLGTARGRRLVREVK
ncbi:MAG: hypothetical protein ACRD9R_11370 [Pyrinomonadaceae bacterium]